MFKVFAYSATLVLLSLGLLACGGGGGGGSNTSAPATGTASFALSDAPVEGLSEVVITIDSIELRRKDSGDCDEDPVTDDCVFIDDFTEKDGEVVDTIRVDLLDLQADKNQIIIQDLELEAGEYDQLRLSIISEDINFSWVKETANADVLKLLKVPSGELKLGGFTVESDGVQVFIIEFDLRKAMTYNPRKENRYILKPTGVRVVEAAPAASISGVVASELFSGNGTEPCVSKGDVNVGNVIYLYRGHGLDTANLADNFDRTEDVDVPETAIAPYTSQQVDAVDGSYGVFYLPAGDYTLAFSCQAENDDPDLFDGIVIPSPDTDPDTTIVELSLGEDEDQTCDLPLVGGACAPVVP